MAVMGVSYGVFLGYVFIPLVITLGYTWWYIFSKVDPESVVPNLSNIRDFNWIRALRGWAPFIATLWFLLATGKSGAIFFFPWFGAMACYYSIICKDWKWGKYLDGKFAIIATIVLALGGVVGVFGFVVGCFPSKGFPLIPGGALRALGGTTMGL